MSYPYFEVKKKIVLAGNSAVFNNWREVTSGKLTEGAFLSGLEWLCADPLDEYGRVTRALALNGDGTLAKLSYYRAVSLKYGTCSTVLRYAENSGKNREGDQWNGSVFTTKLAPAEAMFYGKAEIREHAKIAIGSKDQI